MASLEEMRGQASPEQNIKIYGSFTAAGLAITGIAEAVYFEADHSSYLQALAIGGLVLAANYGTKLVTEIRNFRHHEEQ